MSSTILKTTVSKRRLVISDVQKGLTEKEVDQMANLIPFDSLSTMFPLKAQLDPKALDFVIDTQQFPLYANFDFNEIDHDTKKEVTLVLQGIEYPCIIKRETGTSPSTFFKQNFVLHRN